MKIQLDTYNKIIKIENSVNLGDFVNLIKKILPNGEWKEFKLEVNSIIQSYEPIIIEPYKLFNPYYPWPWYCRTGNLGSDINTFTSIDASGHDGVTCGDINNGSNSFNLNSGTYNIEV